MSRRVEKSFNYHQRVRENELAFAESGLPRPQDAYRDVMFRSRQVNFNLAPSLRRNVDEVLAWRPAAFMTCSRMNFECYGGNPQTLHGQWIRDSEQFEDLMKKLLTEREFALDMEGHNEHSVNGNEQSNKLACFTSIHFHICFNIQLPQSHRNHFTSSSQHLEQRRLPSRSVHN